VTANARNGRPAWPWPADSTLDRSRRVAQSYRAALERSDPETAAAIDAWAVDHGQGWVVGSTWEYDENALLTFAEVADLASIELRTVYAWHRRGLPYTDTVDGLRVRAGDLTRWLRDRRRARVRDTGAP
jgi:hypothetical protein